MRLKICEITDKMHAYYEHSSCRTGSFNSKIDCKDIYNLAAKYLSLLMDVLVHVTEKRIIYTTDQIRGVKEWNLVWTCGGQTPFVKYIRTLLCTLFKWMEIKSQEIKGSRYNCSSQKSLLRSNHIFMWSHHNDLAMKQVALPLTLTSLLS